MDGGKKLGNLINALGTTAEMALVFYRAALSAGATMEEATRLSQAYIGALIFGKGQGQAQNTANRQPEEPQT